MPKLDTPANLCPEVSKRILEDYVLPLRESGGRIPTNRALAKELGVNVGTIAKALYNLKSQRRIHSIVGSGTYVLPSPERKVQFGVYYGANFFSFQPQDKIYMILDRELQRLSKSSNIQLRQYLDTNTYENHIPGISPVLANEAISGLVGSVFVVTSLPENREALLALNVPTIGYCASFSHGGVFFDYRDYATHAAEALIRLGCRKIGLIAGYHYESSLERHFGAMAGFTDALRRAGLPYAPEWCPDIPPRNTEHIQYGRDVFRKLWRNGPNEVPDGLIVSTDAVALGVLQGAKELGVRVPGDLVVAVAENRECIWPELADCVRFQFSISEVAERIFDLLSSESKTLSPVTVAVRARAV